MQTDTENPPVHDGSYLVVIIPVQCLLLCSCDQCFAFPFPAITILSRYQSRPLSVCGTCRIGDCPSIVFTPPLLASSPHHQVGSVRLIRCVPASSSWAAALGVLDKEVNSRVYHREPRCPLHCSPVLRPPSILMVTLLFETI